MKRKEYDAERIIFNGIFGAIIGDALGVPVEFTSREEREKDPVTDFREYGTHNQPKGTWSDDTSMMLATMSSIERCNGIDYDNIMQSFSEWFYSGKYTPYGEVFDAGRTCEKAIRRYAKEHKDPLMCGGKMEDDNGNGSLMRILPVSLIYASMSDCIPLEDDYENGYWSENQVNDTVLTIHNISALTHAHPRSQIACVLYTSICHELIVYRDKILNDQFDYSEVLMQSIQCAVDKTFQYYTETAKKTTWYDEGFGEELKKDVFRRLKDIRAFKKLSHDEIKSSGYVVDTLEAAIWCLVNSSSYEECVLKAVNLGGDTDTIGAVVGGLAGLIARGMYFWIDWKDKIVKYNEIYSALRQFEEIFFEPYMRQNKDLYWKYEVSYFGDSFTTEDLELLHDVEYEISEKEKNYTEKNHPGRDKCDLLRKIRMKIAKANNIDLKIEECHNTHSCLGTCPVCDGEIQYLESELRKKASRGEIISISGLTEEELEDWKYLWGMDLWDTVTKLSPPPDVEDIFEERLIERYKKKNG